MKEGTTVNRIYLLGFIFTVLVIAVHAGNLYLIPEALRQGAAYDAADLLESFIGEELGQIAVPGFFFISGYLFCRSLGGEKITVGDIKRKWKNRLISLVLPYVIWNLIYYVIYLVFGRAEASPRAILDAIVFYGYNPVFWYMQQLIILSVLAPFLYAVLRDSGRKSAIFLLFLFFVVAANTNTVSVHIVNEDALFYYCCGIVAVTFYDELFESEGRDMHRNLMCIGIFLFIMLGFVMTVPGVMGDSLALYTGAIVLRRISGLLAVWFLLCCFRLGKGEPAGWMKITFFIYATHYLVIRALNFIVPKSAVLLLILYLVMPAICVAAAYGGFLVLKRFIPGLCRILCGGRS